MDNTKEAQSTATVQEQNKEPAPTVENGMTYDKAAEHLFNSVFVPVFFNKLASYGFQPASESEAAEMLELAKELEYTSQLQTQKSASDRVSIVSEARQNLRDLVGMPAYPQEEDAEIKQAAEYILTQDPVIKNAALLYNDAWNQLQASQN